MGKKKRQPETLSAQLQRIIGESELTRYRICKMADMDPGQMHRFLTTGRGISIETLDRIGAALRLRLVQDDDE
jgi:predicted transcriptional regulator